MTGAVLVTGGTGTLGRNVVRRLLVARDEDGINRDVRVLSRRADPIDAAGPIDATGSAAPIWYTGDLRTGAGLDAALHGVDTIIHCATDPRRAGADVEGARRLVAHASAAGVRHLVYISIVGIDRIPLGYYRTKLATERVITSAAENGPGWTILRTTQFYDLALTLVGALARAPIVLVPAGVAIQPVDVDEVAQRLVALSAEPPAGRVADLGGPQVWAFADLVRAYLRIRRKRRVIVPVRLPGGLVRALRAGGNLTLEHADGRRTWEEFLQAQL
jgi:uncharacterized protein YbjT (DUF2867 family)